MQPKCISEYLDDRDSDDISDYLEQVRSITNLDQFLKAEMK